MAITISERPDSRPYGTGERKTQQRRFNVIGTADQAAAEAAVAVDDDCPLTVDGLSRQSVHVEPRYVNVDDPDHCVWLGIAEYGILSSSPPEPLEVGDVVVTASTMGGTEHITCPLARLGAYVPEGEMETPIAHGIGDNGEGEVAGVDIAARAIEVEVTKVFASAEAAPEPIVLFALATCTNNAEFSVTDTKTGRTWTFAEGECLFLGHRESRTRTDGALEITYKFAGSPNRSEFEISGTGITVAAKPGWAYLWVLFEKSEDTEAKRMYAKARAAYVEQVYLPGDFSALGLAPEEP